MTIIFFPTISNSCLNLVILPSTSIFFVSNIISLKESVQFIQTDVIIVNPMNHWINNLFFDKSDFSLFG